MVIDGLLPSGGNHKETVECQQARYDRPILIHQTHVKMIIDATGKELRTLYDVVQQNLCALKAMRNELSSPIVTVVLKSKLGITTMFKWQKHSQDKTDVLES